MSEPLPPWIEPHLPAFTSLLRALQRVPGFILQPIETSSRDLDAALASWLTAQGRPTRLVAPTDESGWAGLAAALLAGSHGELVLVSAGATPAPGMDRGLAMVNLHRDGIARAIAAPLLWCGPAAFLRLTWERASDFWSIAGIPRRIEPRPLEFAVPLVTPTPDEPMGLEELERLYAAAMTQGDAANRIRLGIRLADARYAHGHADAARRLVADLNALAPFELEDPWAFRLTDLLERLGHPSERLRALLASRFEEATTRGDPRLSAGWAVRLGQHRAAHGDSVEARQWQERAHTLARQSGDAQLEAAVSIAFMELDVADDPRSPELAARMQRAEELVRRAAAPELQVTLQFLKCIVAVAQERFADALALLEPLDRVASGELAAQVEHQRGLIFVRRGDWSEANAHLRKALARYEQTGQIRGVAATRRLLAYVAARTADPAAAQMHLQAARDADGSSLGIEDMLILATAAEASGDLASAAALGWEVLERLQGAHDRRRAPAVQAWTLELLHRALDALGDPPSRDALDVLVRAADRGQWNAEVSALSAARGAVAAAIERLRSGASDASSTDGSAAPDVPPTGD